MKSSARYWLIKSEPESYGIDHLQADTKTAWTGVRNFQARNFIRDMQPGDKVLFYHSSCKVPGVYGLANVASAPYPDPTQFEEGGHYFEPRATHDKPVWFCVDIAFMQKLKEPVTMTDIRANAKVNPCLSKMMVLQPGSRLSVTEVSEGQYEAIKKM
jgi:predicted RNA-binding protein with PUA-like domain